MNQFKSNPYHAMCLKMARIMKAKAFGAMGDAEHTGIIRIYRKWIERLASSLGCPVVEALRLVTSDRAA